MIELLFTKREKIFSVCFVKFNFYLILKVDIGKEKMNLALMLHRILLEVM